MRMGVVTDQDDGYHTGQKVAQLRSVSDFFTLTKV